MANDRQVEVAGYSWGLRLFGLPFAVFGIYGVIAMLFGIGHLTVTVGDGPGRPATAADVWLPGIFAAIGLGIVLFRYRVVIDGGRRARIRTVGWAWWCRRTETPLAAATSIDIGPAEKRGDGSGRHTAIPVRSVGPTGKVELGEARSFVAARKLAERLAIALDLPVGPGLTGSGAAGRVEDLELPLAKLARPDAEDLRQPSATRVLVVPFDGPADAGIGIRLPRQRSSMLAMLAPLVISGVVWGFLWRPLMDWTGEATPAWWAWRLAPMIVGALISVGIVLWYGLRGPYRSIIRATRDGIDIDGQRIPGEAIRAIETMPGPGPDAGLRVVLDDREIVAASGLTQVELRWIRALIIEELRGQR